MLVSLFAIVALFQSDAPSKIEISSEDYPSLYSSTSLAWLEWLHTEKGWYVFLNGTSTEDKGVRVLLWQDDNTFSLLGFTTAREGISRVESAVIDPENDRILLKGELSPAIYRFIPEEEEPFKRVAIHQFLDDMAIFEGVPIFCSQYGSGRLEPVFEMDAGETLKQINKRLPEIAHHPVESRANFNAMVLACYGDKLAVGSSFINEVSVLQRGETSNVPIRFRGRIEPPKDFKLPKKGKDPYIGWFNGFHHLRHLTWFKGELYGLFRKGFIGLGIWVRLNKDGNSYTWDNNANETQIIAIQDEEVVLGRKEEKEDGEVIRRLWRSSSLP